MADSTRLRTDDSLPLDETALQRASAALAGKKFSAADLRPGGVYDRELISTYLREARFERVVEEAYRQECVKTPWVPVIQAESEEE